LNHVRHVSTLVVLIAMVCLAGGLASAFFGCASTAKEQKTATDGSPAAETRAQDAASAKKDVEDLASLKIQDLSVREEAGQTVVRLKLSKPIARYRHFPLVQPSRIVIDIFGDAKPQAEVQTFRVMTPLVETLRFSYGEGYARLAADVLGTVVPPYTVTAEDGGLRVVIGTQDAKASAKQTVDLVKDGIRVDVRTAEAKPASSGNQGGLPAQDDTRGQTKLYTGQKLSLDFKDADIKNVFRLLAEVSGLNIVVTDEVNKKVTVRLVEVPWDQALDLLIDTNGLGKEQTGNIVRISTAAQLKKEKDDLAAAQKAKDDLEPLQTAYFNVNYAKVKELEPKAKLLLSKRGILTSDDRSNTIVVRDIQSILDDVTELVAKLDTRTPQVLIESNVIETNPTFARALGTKFQFTRGGLTFTSDFPPGSGTAAAGLSPTISVFKNRVGGLTNLTVELTAAEKEGLVKIISRPSVVTLNNVPSTIQSLRILRIALPSSTNIASGSGAAAGTAVATEKIPTGIILTVTPQVSSDGFVLMNINVKSSTVAPTASPSSGAAASGVIPFDEISREAVANVLVRDGETIVVGGILKDTTSTDELGIPWLKDVPIFGWLFKNMSWQKTFEEMMVFITPRIASEGSENLPTAEELWREQMKKTQGDVPPYVSPSP
ncbi:MAG TPA: secretin and TonB N-terminal domain-containing protein, partial [Candidatus Acidoferrales bacterium]|nr:secretin and TonB N-terminal domain-containing protein [Candidatus Acidoferrales bacterium]